MNTMKSSSKFKFSYHSYSCLHVIIMIYELVYGLDVMILTCSTSCFNIHMTCMSRSRTRVEVAVRRSFGFAHILACQSVWLESRGIWIVSLYTGVVLGCTGTFEYDGAPRLRGRRQVMIALSVPCNPPHSGIRVGVCKVSMTWQTKPEDLLVYLTLSSSSNHVCCMIFSCYVHGYIRACRLHLGTVFYSLFSFYP
jgi:hypothetical protein